MKILSISPLNLTLLITSYCALHRKIVCASLCMDSVPTERVGQGEVGGPTGDMHVVAARLGCESTVVGTWWANSCPGYMKRKRYSHLVGGSFLAGRLLGL